MSLDFTESLEDLCQMVAWKNREIINHIGTVRVNERSMSLPKSSGVSSVIRYKQPFHYNNEDYERLIINSFVINEEIARTIVWALPPKTRSEYQVILSEFSQTYKPHEIPKMHNSTVKKIEDIHLKLHLKNHYYNSEEKAFQYAMFGQDK